MIVRRNLGGTWVDVAGDLMALTDGVGICVLRVEPAINFTPIWATPCERPMFHRLAVAPDRTAAVFAKGHDTGAALFVDAAGVRTLGTTHGNNPGAIYHDGTQFVVIWVETPGVLARYTAGDRQTTRTPIPPPWQDVATGILDAPNGVVIFADEGRVYAQPPWSFTKPNVRAGVRVGQWGLPDKDDHSEDRIIVGLPDATVVTALRGFGDDPRVSVLASGRILVGAYTETGAALAVIDPPYPPNEAPPAPAFAFAPFTHNVLIAPFKAEGSGAPDLFSLGTYTEDPTPPSPMPAGRLLIAHDAISQWTPPPSLRPWDIPFIEFYRTPDEAVSDSALRWTTNLMWLLEAWPYDLGVIPMFYTQNRWTIAEILDGLRFLSGLVNLSPRIKVVAPFSYNRANGIVSDPQLLAAFESLKRAAPGVPGFIPIGTPPPAPSPQPTPTPTPPGPHPEPPQPPLTEGLIMMNDLKGLIFAQQVLPHATRPGCSTILQPDGTVFSCRPGGVPGSQPPNFDGGNETCQVVGQAAAFFVDGVHYAFGVIAVDKL